MKYLLDTHVIIWLAGVDAWKLSQKSKDVLFNNGNNLSISVVSLWEIAIKMNNNKLNLGISLEELADKAQQSKIDILPIKLEYLFGLSKLPFYHKDPFDRILISTAICENMVILTADENIQKYDVHWVW
ncbi:MAG: type II toxin-antitoxin system VapC family toxin [Firmicutes bacterium]|nr:type II toxin-antitoxin system VapC family toxin [Bacillota bacterium]